MRQQMESQFGRTMQEDKVAAAKHAEKYAKKIEELEGKNREAQEKLAEKRKKEKSFKAIVASVLPSFGTKDESD